MNRFRRTDLLTVLGVMLLAVAAYCVWTALSIPGEMVTTTVTKTEWVAYGNLTGWMTISLVAIALGAVFLLIGILE